MRTRPARLRVSEMLCVADDVDEVAGTHILGLAHEDGGHATGAALRRYEVGVRVGRAPRDGHSIGMEDGVVAARSSRARDCHSSPSEALYSST